jgi:hypothetical protein
VAALGGRRSLLVYRQQFWKKRSVRLEAQLTGKEKIRMQQLTTGRHQFSRELTSSYHFWVETMFLVMVLAEAIFLILFFRPTLNAETVLCTAMPLALLAVLWFGILRVHRRVHDAFASDAIKGSTGDSRVDTLLDQLAYLSYSGFNTAAVAVAFAYVALIPTRH